MLQIEKLFTANVSGFTIETTYSVSLISISYDSFRESPQAELTLHTPTCLETFQNLADCGNFIIFFFKKKKISYFIK